MYSFHESISILFIIFSQSRNVELLYGLTISNDSKVSLLVFGLVTLRSRHVELLYDLAIFGPTRICPFMIHCPWFKLIQYWIAREGVSIVSKVIGYREPFGSIWCRLFFVFQVSSKNQFGFLHFGTSVLTWSTTI